jgi:diacylglycerol kinase family enzyme
VKGLRVRSVDDRALPLQVDGDYLGEVEEAVFGVKPQGIAVVS